MGIIKKPKVSIGCSACNHNYDFTHLQFNFSFLSTSNKYSIKSLNDVEKQLLVDQMVRLGQYSYLRLINESKTVGFETIEESKLNINANIHPEFYQDSYRKKNSSPKLSLFRLHPNNQGTDCRMVGQLIDKVFYAFYFCHDHKQYK